MQKTKFLSLILFLSFSFLFSFSIADTDSTESLYTLLNSQRTSVINNFNQTSDQVYDKYNKIWKPVVETVVYKSLICLWAITQPFEKINIDIDRDILRKNILEEYILLDWRVKRYELWLVSDFTWLQSDILAFSGKYTPQISQFYTKQLMAISGLVQSVSDYTTQNAQLINDISLKIVKIQSALDAYQWLNDDINTFQDWLSSSQKVFYDKLQNTKSVSSNILNSNLQYLTDQFVKRYKKLPWLESYLLSQKDLSLNIFNDYAQSQINEIFGVNYNQQKYSQVSEAIQQLKSQFYNWSNLNCTQILANYWDTTERKINNIISDISMINSWLSISQVSISTWLSISAQNSAINAMSSMYIQHLNSSLQDFRDFIYQKLQELYDKYINI